MPIVPSEVTIQNNQKVALHLVPTLAGNPAPVSGVPIWSVDDPLKIALAPTVNGMAATATAVGPVGDATVTVTAQGTGGSLTAQALIHVIPQFADAVVITNDPPVVQ